MRRKMLEIVFVTGNKNKLEEAKKILAPLPENVTLTSKMLDLPELQLETNEEITKYKCIEAFKETGGPVLVEDTGLHFHALGNLPGPYIKWFLEKLKPEGLHKMLVGFDNFKATASCTVGFKESADKDPIIFQGLCEGIIVSPRDGKLPTFGWDSCFQPLGKETTFAEMDKDEKNTISHRYKAFEMLKKYLQSRQE